MSGCHVSESLFCVFPVCLSNLSGEKTCDESCLIKNFYFILQELYNFFTLSLKRFDGVRRVIEQQWKFREVENPSHAQTRWAMTCDSVNALWASFDKRLRTFQLIDENSGKDLQGVWHGFSVDGKGPLDPTPVIRIHHFHDANEKRHG